MKATKHQPQTGQCKICGNLRPIYSVTFEENVSYFFRRRERKISGNLCWACIRKTYKTFQTNTALGTWWGAIGCIVGPHMLVLNMLQFRKARAALNRTPK